MNKSGRPILVTLLAVMQLSVGCLLLCCGVIGTVLGVAGNSSATVTISRGGQSTTRVYDTREEMEKEAPGYMSILVGSSVVGLLLHLAMLAGAIGLLMARAWGWWLSLAWALLQIVAQVLTLGYLWNVAMPAANRMVRVVPHDDNGVCGALVNGNTFYHLFWGLYSVGFSFYVFLVLVLLILPPVRRAFVRRNAQDRDDEAEEEDRRG